MSVSGLPGVARAVEFVVLAAVLMSTAVGCGNSRTQPAQPQDRGQPARVVALLYQMKGHLVSSRELWEHGDVMTRSHAAHPRAELFSLVAGELRAVAPAQEKRLLKALERVESLVAAQGSRTANARAAYDEAFAALDEAAAMVAGQQRSTPGFVAQVVAELLRAVGEEYAEAVQGGRLANLEEYQDAYGFLQVARELFGTVREAIRGVNPRKASEVARVFGFLGRWLPAAAAPPNPPADPTQVSRAIAAARTALSEAYGFALANTPPGETLAWIRQRLKLVLEEYRVGHRDRAYELAVSAYLDGFEHLEGLLFAKDRMLVETLEMQFKELREKVKAGAPVAELQELQRKIESNLSRAAELL